MIQAKSCCNDNRHDKKPFSNRFFSGRLFVNLFKRSFPQTLLFGIAQFFSLAVYIALFIPRPDMDYENPYMSLEQIRTMKFFEHNTYAVIAVVLFGAIFAACSVLKYLSSRESTYFAHGLPVKRDCLYITKYLNGAATFLLPFIINLLPLFAVIVTFGGYSAGVASAIAALYFNCTAWFMFIYTLSYMIGVICGGRVVQALLTLIVMYYVPAVYALLGYFNTLFTENVTGIYAGIIRFLSPGTVFLGQYDMKNYISTGEYMVLIAATLVLFALGILLYRRRKSENSEKTIAFPRIGEAVKYLMLVLITLVGGCLFSSFGQLSVGWMIFGLICGAVLSLMLMNSILTKNPREMFVKIKGFAVYAVAFAVCFAAFVFGLRYIDGYFPPSSSVRSIEVGPLYGIDGLVNGENLVFADDEVIDAFNNLLAKHPDNTFEKTYYIFLSQCIGNKYYENGDEKYASDTAVGQVYSYTPDLYITVTLCYKLNSGLEITKRYRVDFQKNEKYLRTILDSEEYKAQYRGKLEKISALVDYKTEYGLAGSMESASENEMRNYLIYLYDNIGFDLYQKTSGGNITLIANSSGNLSQYSDGTVSYYELPLFLGASDENGSGFAFIDRAVESRIDGITKIEVYKSPDVETPVKVYTNATADADREFIKELYLSGVGTFGAVPAAMMADEEYCMVIYYVSGQSGNNEAAVTGFIKGKVPDFVTSD